MNPIEKRLKASINIDAVNGDRQERAICQNQMLEAANEITTLRQRIKALEAVAEAAVLVLAIYHPIETSNAYPEWRVLNGSLQAAGYITGEGE